MLVACRPACLSGLEGRYAGVNRPARYGPSDSRCGFSPQCARHIKTSPGGRTCIGAPTKLKNTIGEFPTTRSPSNVPAAADRADMPGRA